MRRCWTFLKRGLAIRLRPTAGVRSLDLVALEDRITPVAPITTQDTLRSFFGFEQSFSHGLSVAAGDITNDDVADVVVGSGAGSPTRIAILDGVSSTPIRSFLPFATFTGGASVATGDFNGDGIADIVAGAGPGGGPHVRIFDGQSGQEIRSFLAFGHDFRGGLSLAVADFNRDGTPDVVAGAGPGGGPHVKVFDGRTGAELRSFYPFDSGFAGGVTVAAADLTGDGVADVVAGAGAGGGPHVKVFDGVDGTERRSFFAYAPGFPGGVTVSAADVSGDGVADIVTGAGAGGGPHVKLFDGAEGSELGDLFAFSTAFRGGVSVATGDVSGDGVPDLIVGAGPGGGPHVKVFSPASSGEGNFPSDLAGWVQEILGGTPTGTGSLTVSNGVLTMREGDSFRVGLSRAFTVPDAPSAIRVTYERPAFDTISLDQIKDAFEVAVVGSDGSPLALPIGAERDASFNWTEQLDPVAGADTTTTTGVLVGTIEVNLSALPAATAAKLVLRLANNDTDTTTSVRVRRVDVVAAASAAPAGTPPPAERQKVVAPDLTTLADVTPSARIEYGRTTLTDEKTVLTTDVSVRNGGTYPMAGRLVVAVGNLSDPSVDVLDPDGYTADGRPYFDLTPELNGSVLMPGQTSATRTLRFTNPNRERFTFDTQVLAGLDKNPVFYTQPVTLVQAGKPYQYPARAADPDGHALTYSLVVGPAGMTVNPTTGDVSWATTSADLGNHAVRLRARDLLGGTVEQSFTLSVRTVIPNRPPVITSTPNTDATVDGAWEVTTQRTGNTPTGILAGNFGTGTKIVTVNAGDQTLNVSGTSWNVGEQAPNGRTFQTGHEVDVGLPTLVYGQDKQAMPSTAQADLNGDGSLDFITSAASSVDNGYPRGYDVQNFVSVALNYGDGSFAAPTNLPIESSGDRSITDFTARNLTVADFDGDGKADILALYGKLGFYGDPAGPSELLFWKGSGTGTFAAMQKTTLASPLQWIHSADMDGDGKRDLVAADSRYGSTLGILRGNGDGTFAAFAAIPTYAGAGYSQVPALIDVDGRNGLDVVLTSYSPARIDVYLNDGTGMLGQGTAFQITSQMGDGGVSTAAGDFNGDGKTDLAVTTSNDFGVFLGAGDGVNFTYQNGVANPSERIQLGFLINTARTTATDINGDGKLDLLYGKYDNNRGVVVGLGQGNGNFLFQRYAIGNDTSYSEYTNNQDEVAVLAGDYNGDGVIDLAVSTVSSGYGTRALLTVIDAVKPSEFAAPKVVVTGTGVSTSLIGDVNNDGTPDIVNFEAPGNQGTSVFRTSLGNGDGTFAPSQSALGVSGSPISSYLLDINKDGKLDLVFSLIGQDFRGSVYGINQVALGNGDGTFSTSFSTFQGGYFYGNSLFTGDFNNDGYPDLVAFAGAINAPGTLTYVDGFYDIYLNNGGTSGTFTLASHRVIPVGTGQDNSPKSVAVGDFDSDGKWDLVNFIQKTGTTPFQLLLLKGNGDGTLADPIATNVLETNSDSASITWTVAGDMNNDGKADLVVFGAYGQLSIFLGNGDGTFTTPVQYPSGSYPTTGEQFKLLDFNGDGKLDVIKIDTGPYSNKEALSLRLGNGDGTLQAPQTFTNFRGLTGFSVGDLNGDGVQDMLTSSNSVGGQATSYLGTAPGLTAVASGDVNGDGKRDLVAANYANSHVKVLFGNGNDTFRRQADVLVGRGPVALVTADFNGDGKLDIVTANRTGKSVTVLRGDGLGGFTRTDISVGVKPVSLAVGDVTDDGKPDIVTADDGSNAAYLLVNTGNGFAAPVPIPLGDKPKNVTLADITGDGKIDLVVTLPDSKRVMILPGLGNGTFGTPIYVNLPTVPGGLTSGDFNQDGKIDLAVTFPSEGTAAVLYNRGGGLFAKPQAIRVGANPTAVVAQDTSGDGRLDLVVANSGDDTASVILNKYDPTKLYRYTVTATDPDGDPLSFDLTDAPGGMILNPTTGEIVWAPTGDQLGSNLVTIRVNDGQGGTATQSFNIAVTASNSNAKPVFTSTANPVVSSTAAFTYNARAIDADNPNLRYRLVNGPAGASIDPITGKLTWDARSGALTFNQKPFDNSGSSGVSVPDRPELQPASLTAEGWFRFDDPAKNQVLLSKLRRLFYNDTYTFNLTYLYGNLYARVTGSNNQGNYTTKDTAFTWSPVAGRWYHLAMTFDDATGAIGLLINGNLVATATADFHLGYTSGSTSEVNIGKLYGEGFVGSATNIRMWSTARTPEQIRADFLRQVPADSPNLLFDLRFADGDAQTIRDSSINRFDGRRTTGSGPWPTNTIGLAVEQTQQFTIRVEDGRGGFDEQTFDVTVVPPFRGTITGSITRGDTNLPLAGWAVYLDANGNGTRDANEPRALTDGSGNYAFRDLVVGPYTVRLERPSGWNVSSPAGGSHSVNLAASSTAAANNFRIAPTNAAQAVGPKFLPVSPFSTPARNAFRTQVLAYDPTSRPITYSLSLAPTGMAIDPGTGVIAWTPTIQDVGTARILVKATNDRGAVDLLEFTVSVLSPNSSPVVTSSPPGSAFAGVPFRYDVRAQDAEQGALGYSLNTAPAGAVIDAATGRITWLPTSSQLGAQLFTVRVRDGVEGEAVHSFTLNVSAAVGNTAPVLRTSLRGTAKAGVPYQAILTADDADRDVLTYSLVTGPAGLSVSASGLTTWTPATAQIGDNPVTVRVLDGRSGSDELTFTIRVGSGVPNAAPRFTSTPPAFATIHRTWQYDLKPTDADSDAVAFALLEGPDGLSLDPVRGTLRWVPAADQVGSATVRVRAYDPYGGEATQTFTLTARGGSGPPAITSTPTTEAAVGQAFLYSVVAIDAEGDPLTYSLLQAPAGMVIHPITGELSWTPGAAQLGRQAVIVEVSDGVGGRTTQGFGVVVAAGAANRPPVISTVPPLTATQGTVLTFAVAATDPEGSAVRYELRRGPGGMVVEAGSGLVSWNVQDAPAGPTVVTIAAFDTAGAAGILSFELMVLPANHAPTITGSAPGTVFAGGIYRYDVAAADSDLDPIAFTLVNTPAGMTVDAFGRVSWPTSVANIGPHAATVQVNDGRGGVVSRDFAFNVLADTAAPKVSVIPSAVRVAANSPEVFAQYHITPFYPTASVCVTATDNVGVVSLTVTANGKSVVADANGNVTFHFEDWGFGTVRVTATATDAAGNTGLASKPFAFVPFGDDPAAASVSNPVAVITSPGDSESTGGFVNIRGTATSDNFTSYSVLFRRADESTFTLISSGQAAVVNGMLAKWDTTLLENDQYVLRLEESDEIGGVTAYEQSVGVSGNLKLGNFRLSFADLTIPVAGIPITLARTYDTLRADRTGDMGYGWRLEYRNTNLQTGLPKTGLEDLGQYAAVKPGTKVYLTLPGGERQGFTFTPDLRALPSFGGQPLIVATPRFTPDRGVTSTLSTLGGTYILNANNEVVTLGGLNYNPAADEFGGGYTLTQSDGTQFVINGKTGLMNSATDRNGNRLIFSEAGISSSSGVNVTFERDAKGRITKVTDPAGNSVRYSYDSRGDLVHMTDRMGNVTQFSYRTDRPHFLDSVIDPLGRTGARAEYGTDGRLRGTVDANGHTANVSYDPDNSLVTTTDRLGKPTITEYDSRGNVVATTDPLGNTTRFVYNASDRMVATTDPLGRTTRYEYDSAGRPTVITTPLGTTTRVAYDAFGNQVSVADPLGHVTRYENDSKGNPTKRIDPTGATTTFATDTRGLITRVTGPQGETTRYTHDSAGLLTTVTDATGATVDVTSDAVGNTTGESRTFATREGTLTSTWAYQFDANGQLVGSTGPNGQTSRATVNAAGQTTELTNPSRVGQTIGYSPTGDTTAITGGGQGVTIERDANGRETQALLSDGRVLRYEYDAAGRRTATWLPDGSVRRTQYDAAGQETGTTQGSTGERREYDDNGRLVALTGADGLSTRYEYDAAGNLTRVTDGLGGTATYEYDAANRLVAATDAVGRRATTTYDLSGNVITTTDLSSITRTYQYDAAGRRTAVIDASGNVTRFSYDGQNLWDGTTDPLGRITTYVFNVSGQLVRRTLPLGQTERFTYDALGRLASRTDFAGRVANYTYTAGGQVASISDADGTRMFEYDAAGKLSALTDGRGRTAVRTDEFGRVVGWDGPSGTSTAFEYTLAGLPTRVATGTGADVRSTTRTFDPNSGGLTAATDPFGGNTVYTPDPSGLTVRVVYPGGVNADTTRDAAGRPVSVTYTKPGGVTLLQLFYRYDTNGRIDRITQAGGPVTDYVYDLLGRIISEAVTTGGISRVTRYGYDAAGNLTHRTDPDGTATAFATDSNDRLTGDGTWIYTHDANGNLIRRTSAAATEVFTYDARNRLMRAVRTGTGAFDVQYAYDADGLLAERRTTAEMVRYVWDRSTIFPQLLEERDGTGALLRRYESEGANVTQVMDADGTRRLLLTDVQGSPRLVVTAGGVEVARPTYDAYGRVTGGSLVGYTNGLADPLTGLLFLRSRWYSPDTARFLTTDSAPPTQQNPGSVNRYAYVQGDPVNRTDPSGQEPVTLATVLTFIGVTTAVSAGLFAFGGFVSSYRGGWSVFSSYRQMRENLTTYQTGGAIGATFKAGRSVRTACT